MFGLNETFNYYLYPRYIGMGGGIESLHGLLNKEEGCNPLSGDVYLFFGRKRDAVRSFTGIMTDLFYIKKDWKRAPLNSPVFDPAMYFLTLTMRHPKPKSDINWLNLLLIFGQEQCFDYSLSIS